jgi:hypothetical protein
MKSALLFSIVILGAMVAKASAETSEAPLIRSSNEIETTCRIKAKEIAAETYRGCVTEQKNAQIEQIKKEYAAKLQALKSHYEQELKKMNGTKAKAEDMNEAPAAAPSEKIEKIDSAAKAPSKKKSVAVLPKKSNKKAASVVTKAEVTEMTVQLKQSPGTPVNDESTMDLPEPIPVEDVPASESSI